MRSRDGWTEAAPPTPTYRNRKETPDTASEEGNFRKKATPSDAEIEGLVMKRCDEFKDRARKTVKMVVRQKTKTWRGHDILNHIQCKVMYFRSISG